MANRVKVIVQAVQETLAKSASGVGRGVAGAAGAVLRVRGQLVLVGVLAAGGYALYSHPPFQAIGRGQVGIRTNRLTGSTVALHEGSVLMVPGLHQLRTFDLRDQVYHPVQSSKADGEAPFQSVEGLSLGVDLSVRYALDQNRVVAMSQQLPDDLSKQIVEPAVQGVIYKVFTRYTVREIFSSKRAEIQKSIESELAPKLAADGVKLRGVLIGKVDLPPDYRAGMEKLLAEELESEKMRFTLELKDKQVKQTALEAEAEKVRREKAAEAAGNEQIIAARAQEEAMKHVLPFKQKQIEQRQLEAEAAKVAQIKNAEGSAQARQIEAVGEAESRRKLADADAYRMAEIGKVTSEQMARDGELISKHPLLIQKTMADKLSDKISVIIAPPGTNGFVAAGLVGGGNTKAATAAAQTADAEAAAEEGAQ